MLHSPDHRVSTLTCPVPSRNDVKVVKKCHEAVCWVERRSRVAPAQKELAQVGRPVRSPHPGLRPGSAHLPSSMFSLQVANEACGPDACSFSRSAGETRQIDFILFSTNMFCTGYSGPTHHIDLGSNHRAVWCKLATHQRAKKPSGATEKSCDERMEAKKHT